MIKREKGITLISLIITIALMLIISSVTIYTSLDRFEINKYNKMVNDIELLSDKVSNYYLKYNGLPVLRDNDNNSIKYTYTQVDFSNADKDNENYYILDLTAMEAISLNYGKEGFENPNTSDDVYIINEASHQIYYVRGMELNDTIYHTVQNNETIEDTIPPSKPQIKVISGNKNEEGIYISDVVLEFVPGNDNWSGVSKTEYSIDEGTTWISIDELENNIYNISTDGTYNISLRSYDNNTNTSSVIEEKIQVSKLDIGDFVEYNLTYTDMYTGHEYASTDGWQYIGTDDEGNYLILSTGVPCMLSYYEYSGNPSWWATDEEIQEKYGDTYDDTYVGMRAALGLRNKFAIVPFVYQEEGVESSTYNQGIFRKINGVVEGTLTGNVFMSTEYGSDVLGAHVLSLEEINKARNLDEFNTTIVGSPFTLSNQNTDHIITILSTADPEATSKRLCTCTYSKWSCWT